jgi:hypothetical protein
MTTYHEHSSTGHYHNISPLNIENDYVEYLHYSTVTMTSPCKCSIGVYHDTSSYILHPQVKWVKTTRFFLSYPFNWLFNAQICKTSVNQWVNMTNNSRNCTCCVINNKIWKQTISGLIDFR